jgi:hypothetical protein
MKEYNWKELAKNGLDLMEEQEVRWGRNGMESAENCTFFSGERNDNRHF